eukprot:TRINITY_DN4466_c0_g1_i1.p2 TRINITY_DN4466_c0_g1~~TRINITY_DN4466_c0_g1_i1.p2  ORF type:complete len:103 (-),score=10.67 TRINITY_DN4466_c0_g1_i1:272-580(-)
MRCVRRSHSARSIGVLLPWMRLRPLRQMLLPDLAITLTLSLSLNLSLTATAASSRVHATPEEFHDTQIMMDISFLIRMSTAELWMESGAQELRRNSANRSMK